MARLDTRMTCEYCDRRGEDVRPYRIAGAEENVALCPECAFPIGTRIQLDAMPDDPDPIPEGARGTVFGFGPGQLWVNWDNGRTLALITTIDEWSRLP